MKYYCLVLFVYVITGTSTVKCGFVRMFPEKNFTGISFNVSMSYENQECINLPPNFQKDISSVETGNLCLELYSGMDCSERNIILYPGTNYSNLLFWRFDNATVSAKVCSEHKNDRNTEGQKTAILLNPGIHTGGLNEIEYNLNVKNCENLPKDYSVHSIQEHNTCFEYFSSENCQKEPLAFTRDDSGLIFNQTGLTSIDSIGRCTFDDPIMDFSTTINPSTTNHDNIKNSIIITLNSTGVSFYPTSKPQIPVLTNTASKLINPNSTADKKVVEKKLKPKIISTSVDIGVGLFVSVLIFVSGYVILIYIYKQPVLNKSMAFLSQHKTENIV